MGPIFRHALTIHALAFLVAPALSSQAIERAPLLPRYLPVDLGVLPGWTSGRAVDVNEARQVAGTMVVNGASMAFVWLPRADLGLPAGMTALGSMPLGVTNGSWSSAIDDCGRIVGVAWGNTPPFPTAQRAFLWQDGVLHDLGSLVGSSSGANAINQKGVIVGWSYLGPTTLRAFATRVRCGDRPSGDLVDLGSLAGSWSVANAVNDEGQVVGTTSLQTSSTTVIGAPFYRDAMGGSLDLPLLPGMNNGSASAINEQGVVVGNCRTMLPGVFNERAVLWRRTHGAWSVTDLGMPAGRTRIGTSAIDEKERVVGIVSTDGTSLQAFLWFRGVFHAIDDLLVTSEPIRIGRTGGMNRRGDIAVEGTNAQGETRAYLLLRVR